MAVQINYQVPPPNSLHFPNIPVQFSVPPPGLVPVVRPDAVVAGLQPPTTHQQQSSSSADPTAQLAQKTDSTWYDGKRMRSKYSLRRTVDYNTSMVNYLENRIWQRDHRDRQALETDISYGALVSSP